MDYSVCVRTRASFKESRCFARDRHDHVHQTVAARDECKLNNLWRYSSLSKILIFMRRPCRSWSIRILCAILIVSCCYCLCTAIRTMMRGRWCVRLTFVLRIHVRGADRSAQFIRIWINYFLESTPFTCERRAGRTAHGHHSAGIDLQIAK